jgi:hypothetical protein
MEKLNIASTMVHCSGARNSANIAATHADQNSELPLASVEAKEYEETTELRKPRKTGYARHLLEGVDVDALLATPIPGIEEYRPS